MDPWGFSVLFTLFLSSLKILKMMMMVMIRARRGKEEEGHRLFLSVTWLGREEVKPCNG